MAETAIIAEPDRRFQAFVIDRALVVSVAGVAGLAAWLLGGGPWAWAGVTTAAGFVAGLVMAIVAGVTGRTPGKAWRGLRMVDAQTGLPIGVGRSLLRSILTTSGLVPLFGLGTATLAWTAMEDQTGERRGWHDHVTGSVVIDVRPRPVVEAEVVAQPRHVVNLTAMKLVPVRQAVAPQQGAQPHAPLRSTPPARAVGTPPPAAPSAGMSTGTSTGQRPRPAGAAVPPPGPAPRPADPAVPPSQPAPHQGPGGAPTVTPAPGPHGTGIPHDPTSTGQAPVHPAHGTAPHARTTPAAPPPARPEPDQQARSGDATASQPVAQRPRISVDWRVTFDSGETFVVEGLALVGRAPSAREGEPVRHVVPLASQDMSISKTHAQFHLASDGALVVTDRGSTNGSFLIRKGVSRELPAGRATTLVHDDRVAFGDRIMHVTREG
ncbi:RDD family protein [Nocardioides sp. AE5]|uniref:RDD family protein n=1 Tax=Nocardioides sp. AE5 TaxID=2962573 RepID=UPI0028818E3B|nr:RDD family protein [Nocardioides sp. AE5]MDT0203708.1 RDD family protein [Nocardioides sp. AE5]